MNINESKAILPNMVQTPIKDSSPHHQSLGDVGQKGPERLKGNDDKNIEKSYQRFSLCPSGPYPFQTTLRASGLFMAVACSHGGKNIAMLVFLPWAMLLRPTGAFQ